MKLKIYISIIILLNAITLISVAQPLVSVSPDSLSATIVACDDSTTIPLTIYNTGTSDLNYNISGSFTSIPVGYCIPTYGSMCSSADYINNFSFNTLNKLNSGCNGLPSNYIFDQSVTTSVNPGGTYQISMQAGLSYSQGFGVWIDYNRDGDFDDLNEFVYASPSASTSLYTAFVTVPIDASVGKTMLRVRCRYSSTVTSTEICSQFSYGETEDYAISIGQPFITSSPNTGTIIPGDSAIIQVKFKSFGLNAGTYLNNLTISSNDTLNPQVNIPSILTVVGIPNIVISADSLNFDSIMQSAVSTITLVVSNNGCGNLDVTNITNLNSAFTVDSTSFSILPGQSYNLNVTFNPISLGDFFDTLNIINNDTNLTISLYGFSTDPPVISWTPSSFNVAVNTCNDSIAEQITVYNTGTYPLSWSLDVPAEQSLTFDGNDYVSITNVTGFPTGSVMTAEAWVYPTAYADANYNGVVSFGPRWCTGSSFLLAMSSAGRPTFASWCNDYIPASGPTATLNTWHHIAAVLNGANLTLYLDDYSWTTTLSYVPSISNSTCMIGCTDAPGRYFNGKIDEVRIWNSARTASQISHNKNKTINPIQTDLISYWNFNSGAGTTVSDLTGNGHNGIINGATRTFSSALSNMLSLSTSSGTILNGDSTVIDIYFNSTNLISGVYSGNIIVNSNDPLSLIDSIPYTFTVNGYPLISSSTNCLEMDSILQFSIKKDSLWFRNSGCDTLHISSLSSVTGAFITDVSNLAVYPGDSGKVVISFVPTIIGDIYDTLHVVSDDINLDICLHGYSMSPPIISANPTNILATINACGDSAIVPLTIYNTGNYDLYYSLNNSALLPALCTPVTTGYCCGMGIYNVKFNTIDNTTPDGVQSYMDYSATNQTLLGAGQTYSLSVETGVQYNEHVVAWIDYNNNGIFEATEKILESVSQYINHSANITIPNNAVENTPLRMRIGSDYSGNAIPQPCVNVGYGQFEDYSVFIGNEISYINPTDTVISGDSSIVDIIFHSDNLLTGVFSGNIFISSNDPLNTNDTIPYTLTFNGNPIISSSDTCVTFDSLLQYTNAVDSMWIYNIGCDSLFITDISNLNSAFTVDTTYLKIYPGDSAMIHISFSPIVTGDIYDTLQIVNNDSILNICLHGYVFSPPIISVNPDTIFAIFNTCNDSLTFPLTIYNSGSYDLTWGLTSDMGILSDNFEPDINFSMWTTINGGIASASCSYFSSGNALYFNAGSLREAITKSFNTSYGGIIEFYLKIGTGASPCENADGGENVILQYSVDNGNTWLNINTYLADNYSNFTLIQENIPIAARTLNTIFKWSQPINSGTGSDNWALDNVSFLNVNGSFSFDTIAGTVLPGDSNIVNVTVHSEGLISGTYDNGIIIQSNDPLNSSDTLNVQIVVNGYPEIASSSMCFEFDSILQFTSKKDTLHFYNTGCDTLFITDMSNTLNVFNFKTSLYSRVSNSEDDAEEEVLTGIMSLNSSDLELINDFGTNQVVGTRFKKITIPQGAVINDAYIEFECDEAFSDVTNLTIYCEGTDSAFAFTDSLYNISSRIRTSQSVLWNTLPAWTVNSKYTTPSLKSIIQEVVSRSGWNSGNSIAFIIEGSGNRTAEAFDGESYSAPLLYVDYSPAKQLYVAPGDTGEVVITFSPQTTGDFFDTLLVTNNDSNINICLHGYAYPPPTISHYPDTINATLGCSDSTTIQLTYYNTGSFDLSITNIDDFSGVPPLFYDNFEDGVFNGWGSGTCSFTNTVTNVLPAVGSNCLKMVGGCNSHYQGPIYNFGTSTPTYVSFWAKSGSTTLNDAYFVIGENASNTATQMAFFYMSNSGTMGLSGPGIFYPYNANQWYHVEFKNIDYSALTFDYYVDDILISALVPFRGSNITNNEVRLYNYNNSTSYFDDIIIGDGPIGQQWLSIDTTSATIATNDSLIVNVNLHSDGLLVGQYSSYIVASSNDPLNQVDSMLVMLNVVGAPIISTSDTCLVFDTIVQWQTNSKDFTVYNSGCDTLFITNIVSNLPEFTTTDTTFIIIPGDSTLISVLFSPISVGNFNGTLDIYSNTTLESICLTGVSLSPPSISFSPTSLTANITACNDTFTTPLTIYNTGDYNLIYSVGGESILSPLCSPITTSYCCGIGITRVQFNTINNFTVDASDSYKDYTSTIQTQLYSGYTYPVSVRTGNTYAESVRIWIDYNNNGTFEGTEKVFESVNQLLNHNGNITIPTTATMQTPIRMRVASDLGTNAMPLPCVDIQYGQVEDYKLIIGNGITFTNPIDTVLPGDSAIVNVNLNASMTSSGTFIYNIILNSNDPLNPSVSVPFNIVIDTMPSQPVVIDEAICFGAITPDLVATGTNVDWFSDGALTTNIFSGNTYNNGETAVGQYTYYVTQTVNNCQSPSDTITLSINPVYNLSDAQSICNGDSYIFGTQTLTTSGTYIETFQTVNGCDSVVTLTLTVNPTYSEVDSASICNGNSYIFGTQTLTTSGTYVETFQTVNGCDSVVTLTFTVYPTYNVTDSTSITCGGSYTFGTQTLTTAGIYVETFNTINSCDSVVTLTLTMIPTYTVFDNATICDGDVFSFGTQNLTIAGIYNETFTALDGCDSLVTLTLNVNPVFATTDSASITCGNSYTFGTQTLTVAGVYNETFTAINACDSVVTLTLDMIPSYTTTDSVAICDGDTYIFGTQTLSANGIYNETFTAGDGCDSLVTLTLYIKPTFSSLDAATICNGDSYTLGTQTLTIAGAYVETFTAINGCDSVVYFSLSVNPTYNLTDSTAICQGDSYIFGTQTLTSAGIYVETFSSINGCDSVVTLTLTINPIYAVADVATICNGDNFIFGTQTLSSAGNYSETFSSVYGCDSTVVLTLNVNPTFATNDTAIICDGDNFVFGTQNLTIAGDYVETYTAINGCDSVVSLNLIVNPTYSEVDSDSITCGASFVFGTQTLTSEGIYSETFTSINGCDSVVTLTLSMIPSFTTLDSATICDGDSYVLGTQTLMIAGVYNETFTAVDGCDSLVTFTLTVNPTYNVTDNASICDGGSYTFGTQTLTATGVYTETFTTINGCDSVVTLTFTVNSTYNVTDSTAICNGNSFTFGTQTLTIAGVYVETFSSINGCDSVVTFTLTVNAVYSETDSATICDGDSYIFGTQTLSVVGVYNETFSTVNGCDSVVSLTLFVNPVYAELDTVSITCGASYIFGTQTLSSAGNYIETFSTVNGCDSVVNLNLLMIPSYTSTDSIAICDGDSYIFGTQTLNIAGQYSETFSAVDGCDSLVNLTLNVNPIYSEIDSISITCGQTYNFGTQSITTAGIYTETFNTVNGCDSVVSLTVYMIPFYNVNDTVAICQGDSYNFGTQTLTLAGDYTETFIAVDGCDSLVNLNLAIKFPTVGNDVASICLGDSYIFGTQTLTLGGIYNETFVGSNGCDSIVTLVLTVNPTYVNTDSIAICDGGSYVFGTQNLSVAGVYTETFTSINGCDSVVTLTLTINPVFATTDVATICDGDSIVFGTQTLAVTGVYTETFVSELGCDSVVTLTLSVNPNYNISIADSINCGGSYVLGTQTLTIAGNYTEVFSTSLGCDSIVNLTLNMIPEFTTADSATICSNDSVYFGDQYLSISGVYSYTFSAVDACDSLVTFTLNVNPSYSISIADSITCGGSYTLGTQTLTSAGTYVELFTTANGCDSIVTLNLSVIPAYTTFDAVTICDGDSYVFGTQTLSIAGVYNETFVAVDDCDSLVTLTLSVNPSYSDTITASINCGETYIFNSDTLTLAGTYYDSLLTTLGCDSIKVLNLSVNPEFNISYPAEICDGEEFVFGIDTLTTAGTYYETFVAVDGCDSLVTLNLFVLPVYSVTDNATICEGDSYSFGTQTLSIAGVYNETFSSVFGCDSVVTLTLIVNPISQATIFDSISCGQTYDFYGTILDSANTYFHTLIAANGCDSIITLNLSMIPSYVTTDSGIICDGDEFVFGAQTLTIAGVYNETFTAINGCDSLVSLTLTVKPSPQTALLDSISCGETYAFAGLTLSVAGTYYDSLVAANGCDSIVTLYLAMHPSFITPLTDTICAGEEYVFGTDTLTAQGVYNHTLTAVNGCDSLVTLTLTVTPLPSTPIVADISKCTGSVFPTFTSSTLVNWYADSLLTTLLSTSLSYIPLDSAAGTYNYYVTQTANGCTSLYETATLQIYQTPTAPISSDAGVCFGNVNPVLFASGTNICWYSDMMLTDTLTVGNAYQPIVNSIGSYTYYITQRSDYCGVSPSTQVVFEITNPSAAPQANDVEVCFGTQTPDLSILPPFGIVNWYNEPELVTLINTGSTFTTGMTNVGVYTFYYNQTYSGCVSSTGNVTLTINPKPLVTLDNYYVAINKGDSVTINAYNADTYTWTPALGLNTSTGSQVIASPQNTTIYVVTGINSEGCSDSASCKVEVGQIGVDEASFSQSVNVYPNPANNYITVEYSSLRRDNIRLVIYNALNQIIFTKDVIAENGKLIETINLENLPDAIYSLQIIRDNSVVNKKVVVKH